MLRRGGNNTFKIPIFLDVHVGLNGFSEGLKSNKLLLSPP